MRKIYSQSTKIWQRELNEKSRIVLWIDPFFEEDDEKIRAIKIYRNGVPYIFLRDKDQIPFYHITREAELDTYRHHFSLYLNDEHFVLTLDPFTFTATIEGYYNDLWV
jgi:hypothetical protein